MSMKIIIITGFVDIFFLTYLGFPFYIINVSFFFFVFSRATPMAYGASQARGLIGAIATGLCHRHSNTGSEPSLQPTPQLAATQDP